MLNFYPGPSKLYPQVREYLNLAYEEGVLNIPHRGDRFVQLSRSTIELLKKKLNIPADYYVFFTSSATECWEICIQSLTKTKSLHVYNGSFGQKWFEYAKKIRPKSEGVAFDINDALPIEDLELEKTTELLCLTQNETSNGTALNATTILNLNNKFKDKLIAVDATSSMAGLNLKFIRADVWFASVQKCFGLPPGLGILVCSPRAIFRAKEIGEKNHYNSLISMYEKMLNWQTTHTPNILAIYLLKNILLNRPAIKGIDHMLNQRALELYEFFEQFPKFKLLIENPEVRSQTVIAVQANDKLVDEVKKNALNYDILLGNGYGDWSKNTFRIANFPQISNNDLDELKSFFLSHYG